MRAFYNDIDPYCCRVLRKQIAIGNLPEGDVDERDIRELCAADLVGYAHIHLFAGIGGFPYGLRRACYPDSLRTLTGGFPCTDISNAGKRAGIEGKQSGLWKEMYRLLVESLDCNCGFDYILIENVSALASRGLDTVLIDLAKAGYDAQWTCLRASDFGAPHQRERIFIVAYPVRSQRWTYPQRGQDVTDGDDSRWQETAGGLALRRETLADPTGTRLPLRRQPGLTASDTQGGAGVDAQPERCDETLGNAHYAGQQERDAPAKPGRESLPAWGDAENGSLWQPEPRLGGMFTGLPSRLDGYRWPARPGESQAAWEPPRVVTEKKINRVARLKALGNAIVPQCAEYIAHCILAALQEDEEVAG